MTRVNHVDHVLLLLRERLQRIGRSRAGRTGASRKATEGPMARLQSLAAMDQLSEDDFRRTMIRALLTEELGDKLANDAAFQGIVEDVFRILGESEEGRGLIERAERQLRAEN